MKKQLEISLDKAREIYAKGDETMNALLLQTFSKEELENKEINSWEDLGRIEGYYVESNSEIRNFGILQLDQEHRNIWATEEQAEASLAMSQLSQLMKYYNGDWTPEIWSDPDSGTKHCINFYSGILCRCETTGSSHFLAFPTKYIRDIFLEKHRDLIEQAKPLL